MKRPKYKIFKKHKDLIEQAIANIITRQLVKAERVKEIKEKVIEKLKEKNWLAWAQRQVRR